MKDKELREKVWEVVFDAENLKLRVSRIEGGDEYKVLEEKLSVLYSIVGTLDINDCPKCEHPVLAKGIFITGIQPIFDGRGFQCLTCGSRFTCTEKCVCELVG